MFLRLEVFGHYCEIGRTSEAQPEEIEPAPDNAPQPMQIFVEPVGFRVIGDGCDIATDA